MLNVIRGTQFKRDVKLAIRRGKDMSKIRRVVLLLMQRSLLPLQYRDHPLRGVWNDHRDCHIEPDWILIYRVDGEDLYLVRTGTHADLFE